MRAEAGFDRPPKVYYVLQLHCQHYYIMAEMKYESYKTINKVSNKLCSNQQPQVKPQGKQINYSGSN